MKGSVWWRAKVSRQFVLWKEGLKGLIIETSEKITMIRYYDIIVFMIYTVEIVIDYNRYTRERGIV